MKCREEAEQLLGREVAASQAALELGSLCSVAAITDGPNGSYISALGRLQVGLLPLSLLQLVSVCSIGC